MMWVAQALSVITALVAFIWWLISQIDSENLSDPVLQRFVSLLLLLSQVVIFGVLAGWWR